MRVQRTMEVALLALLISSVARAAEPPPNSTWLPGAHWDATTGLPDENVYAAAWHANRLYAATRSGLFRYDGVEWEVVLGQEATFVLQNSNGELIVGGDAGIWRIDAASIVYEVPSAPDSVRCLLRSRDGSTWFAGTRQGLSSAARLDDEWREILPNARVESLAESPSREIFAGTFGSGLFHASAPQAQVGNWHQLRCPSIGTTDSLAGDFVHDLDFDEDGVLHLVTSAWSVGENYQIYSNARDAGLIGPNETHVYAGSALSRWDRTRWDVKYLYQQYRHEESSRIDSPRGLVTMWDTNGDASVEVLMALTPGRTLSPRGVVCFDRKTGQKRWTYRTAGKPGLLLRVEWGGQPAILVTSTAAANGARYGPDDDESSNVIILSAEGKELARQTWHDQTIRMSSPRVDPIDGAIPLDQIYVMVSATKGPLRPDVWNFDPHFSRWTPSQHVISLAKSTALVSIVVHENRHLIASVTESAPNRAQVIDLRTGTVVREWQVRQLLPELSAGVRFRVAMRSTLQGWTLVVSGSERYALCTDQGVTYGEFPHPAPRASWSWLRDIDSPTGYSAHAVIGNTLELWRPRPKTNGLASRDNGPDALRREDYSKVLRITSPTTMTEAVRMTEAIGIGCGGVTLDLRPAGKLVFRSALEEPIGTMPLPTLFANTPDMVWLGSLNSYRLDQPKRYFFAGSKESWPWRMIRFNTETRKFSTAYKPNLPFVDRGCMAVLSYDPSNDLMGSEGGLRRAVLGQPRDLGRWIGDQHTRGIGTEGSRVLTWGRGGIASYSTGSELLDKMVDDILTIDDQYWWVRDDHIELLSERGPAATNAISVQLTDRFGVNESPWQIDATQSSFWVSQRTSNSTRSRTMLVDRLDSVPSAVELSERAFWFGGSERNLVRAFELSPDHYLAFCDFGLREVWPHQNEPPYRDLDTAHKYRGVVSSQDGWTAIDRDGRILRVELADANTVITEVDRIPLATPERVRNLHRLEGEIYALTNLRWVRVSDHRSWTVPSGETLVSAHPRADGGMWIGISNGVLRFAADSPEFIRVRTPGLPQAPVVRVLETSDADELLVVCRGKGLYRVPLDLSGALTVHAKNDSLRVALFPAASAIPTAVELRDSSTKPWRRAEWTPSSRGYAVVALPDRDFGRHQVEVRAMDAGGAILEWPQPITFERRLDSPTVQAMVLLMMGLIGVLSRLLLGGRRLGSTLGLERLTLWVVGFVGVCLATFLTLHFVLLITVPWGTGSALAATAVLMESLGQRRAQQRRLEPRVARRQLLDLVQRFHHRGGRFSSVNDLLLNMRNIEYLRQSSDDDPLHHIIELCRRVLHDTDALAKQLRPLGRDALVDQWLIDQLGGPLNFVRDRMQGLTAAKDAQWHLLLQTRENESLARAGQGFLDGITAMRRFLLDTLGCDLSLVATERAKHYQRQSKGRVEIRTSLGDGLTEAPVGRDQVEELLDNLVRNALRAMNDQDDAKVLLSTAATNGNVILRVDDNGPGIPDDLADTVFDAGVSASGGTGYGLGRCRELTEGWAATIEVRPSNFGRGAAFEVCIPLAPNPR